MIREEGNAPGERRSSRAPGTIQPHGFLLALDDGLQVRMASANTDALLGVPASTLLDSRLLPAHVGEAAVGALARVAGGTAPDHINPFPVLARARTFDGVAHRSSGLWVVECEPAPGGAGATRAFLGGSQRAIDRLEDLRSMRACVEVAVEEVRRLTGFDRVMGFQLHPDESGEIVAEDRALCLEPCVGLRYPATDLLAQARRLGDASLLCAIADTRHRPVPVVPAAHPLTGEPLDMRHAVLRSVSPAHLAHLDDLGVRAAMSVPILVDGDLWGLIACHHMTPRQVPYSVRMTCLLIARVLGLLLSRAAAHERDARRARAADIRAALLAQAATEDVLGGLTVPHPNVLDLIEAGGAAVTLDNRIALLGDTPPREVVAEIVAWLGRTLRLRGCYATGDLARECPAVAAHRRTASGLLAIDFHAERGGYVLWLRPEVTTTVRWGRAPERLTRAGDPGAVSPARPGAACTQTVHGISAPWHPGDEDVAIDLRHELTALALRQTSECERLRELFLGVLGHDLRNPLDAITVATELLQSGSPSIGTGRIAARIAGSAQRMRRLVDHLLDFARIRSGVGLGIAPRPTDLHALVRRIVDENQLAMPGMEVELSLDGDATCPVDPDRIEQVLSNLLSNARHHGHPARPIRISVARTDERVAIACHNHGEPIPVDVMPRLFEPYTVSSRARRSRSGGLGLGLYITHAIVTAHGGQVEVTSTAAEGTTFRVVLPATEQPEG